jgi:ABC-2 type transport system ATP-binding protein
VLDDVSLEIPTECIYGVFGRNGSGKSAFINCLAGLEKPTRGEIVREEGIRCSAAIQRTGLAPDLTVSENLFLFAALGGVPKRRRTNRVAQVIQALSLSSFKNSLADSLSPGIRAKTEIARALVVDSNLVFIDGLLDVLDSVGVDEVWSAMLSRRREEGTTFVVATSRADVAGRCEYVALFHEGRLLAMGAPSEIKSTFRADTVVVDAIRSPLIRGKIKKRFGLLVEDVEGMLKFQSASSTNDVLDILEEHGSEVGAVYLRQPTLEDVLDRLAGGNASGE